MTRPIRYLPSHDVIAMRYACMVCGHCSHCCCRACFSRKLCSCGVGSVIMEVYDGVRNLWFSVISKPYRLRSLVFRVCMNACAHVADNPIGLFLLRFRCSMNITRTVNIYPTCGDMWKSFRFIISWRWSLRRERGERHIAQRHCGCDRCVHGCRWSLFETSEPRCIGNSLFSLFIMETSCLVHEEEC